MNKQFIGIVANEAAAEHAIELLDVLRDASYNLLPFGYGWVLLNNTYRVYINYVGAPTDSAKTIIMDIVLETLEPVLEDGCANCQHNEACLSDPLTCGYWVI